MADSAEYDETSAGHAGHGECGAQDDARIAQTDGSKTQVAGKSPDQSIRRSDTYQVILASLLRHLQDHRTPALSVRREGTE